MRETAGDLHVLVQATGDAIMVADVQGCMVLWNPAAERLFGCTEAEAVGRSLDLIIPERFRERYWTGYRTVMETGQTRYSTQGLRVPARHKEGQRLSMAFTVTVLHSPEGALTGIAAIVRDDTARWQAEQALRQRLAALAGREAST